MAESPEHYKSRLLSYIEGDDFLAVLSETPEVLADLIQHASNAMLARRPRPGKWNINEIVGHLVDDEVATAWRYRQMIERDGAPLAGFDQDDWVRLGRFAETPAKDSLALFTQLRDYNVRMLRSLTPEEWSRRGLHAERGETSVRDLATHMAGHDRNHVRQIQEILSSDLESE